MATNYKYVNETGLTQVFTIMKDWDATARTSAVSAAKDYTDAEIAKLPVYKPGTGISIGADGTISATGDAAVNPDALPAASKTQLGAVKIGDGISVVNGTISVTHPDVYTKTEANNKFRTAAQVEAAVTAGIAKVVDGAPEQFDTLKEIADTLNKDTEGGVINSLLTTIGTKANAADVYTKTAADDAISAAVTAGTNGLATTAAVNTAKTEAINAAASAAAGIYQRKDEMPAFTAFTNAEITAIANNVAKAL